MTYFGLYSRYISAALFSERDMSSSVRLSSVCNVRAPYSDDKRTDDDIANSDKFTFAKS